MKRGFSFTNEDKDILRSLGCPEKDWAQMELAVSKTTFTLWDNGTETRIGRDKASAILGRTAFLSGMARSAFHFSAVREAEDGKRVYFDSSRYFDE